MGGGGWGGGCVVETKSLMGRTFVVRGDHKCWVSVGGGGGGGGGGISRGTSSFSLDMNFRVLFEYFIVQILNLIQAVMVLLQYVLMCCYLFPKYSLEGLPNTRVGLSRDISILTDEVTLVPSLTR